MPAPCLPRVAALPAAPSSLPSSSAAWTDRVLPAPDAERRLSKEDAKGSGNILNWQPKVSKAKKQAINAANKDAVELPAALAPKAKWAGTGMVNKMPPAVAEKLASLYATWHQQWTGLMHTWLLRWQISRRRATAAQRKIWKMNLFCSVLELISASY